MGTAFSREKSSYDDSNTPTISSIQVADNQYWIRLSLGNIIHGAQATRDLLIKNFKLPKDKRRLHSLLAVAKTNNKCHIKPYVWANLLGQCKKGCAQQCNEEVNLDDLDITSLVNIYNNVEHIIPSDILSQSDIKKLKMEYKDPVNALTNERNIVAHDTLKISMLEDEFDQRWLQIRSSLAAMGYSKLHHFDDLKTCSLDPYLEKKIMVMYQTIEILQHKTEHNKSDLDALKTIVSSLCEEADRHNNNTENGVKMRNELALMKGKLALNLVSQ